MDGEQVGACWIATGYDQVGTNVALIAEEMLLEHGHAGYDAWFAAGGEGVEFEVGGYEGCREFGVGCSAGAGAPNLRRDEVQLLTVLSSC